MKLLDKNTVGIYIADKFLVLSLDDMSIRQKLFFSKPPQRQGINHYGDTYFIRSYLKNESGVLQNTVVLGYQGVIAQVLELNYETNFYEKLEETFKPRGDYYLSDSNSGVSFWNENMVPSTLRKEYKILHREQEDRYPGYEVVVVSNSEKLVATLGGESWGRIKLHTINRTSFELKELWTIEPPNGFYSNSKLRFTEDDRFLFLNL